MTTACEIHVSMFCNLIGGALFHPPHYNMKCALTLPGSPFVRWVGPGDDAKESVTTAMNLINRPHQVYIHYTCITQNRDSKSVAIDSCHDSCAQMVVHLLWCIAYSVLLWTLGTIHWGIYIKFCRILYWRWQVRINIIDNYFLFSLFLYFCTIQMQQVSAILSCAQRLPIPEKNKPPAAYFRAQTVLCRIAIPQWSCHEVWG